MIVMTRTNRSGRNNGRLGSGSNAKEEQVANNLIRERLEMLALLGAAPAVMGTGAGIINAVQGEDATVLDNALLQTMGNAAGYGAIGAGIGALTTPGIQRQAVLDSRLALMFAAILRKIAPCVES